MVGVVATETDELEDVVNGQRRDASVEPEFDVTVLCLNAFLDRHYLGTNYRFWKIIKS